MHAIDAVRRFNRFYTRHVGALGPGLVGTPFALPEARVLYELGHGEAATASALGETMDLDAGYLSRLLRGLRRKGLLRGQRSREDGRQTLLSLTPKGRKAFAELEGRTREHVGGMLGALSADGGGRLVQAMGAIESLLSKRETQIELRAHRPGDMGWVIERHGALYHQEYGWDERFEALVAGIAAKFVQDFDPQRERCWIAERAGERLGCVFVVKESTTTAKLRLLIVEPSARGAGLGRRLVEECIAFAREKGYRRLVLWTQSNLVAARSIYRRAGFVLREKQPHRDFGVPLTGEFWELELKQPQRGT